MKRLLIVEDEWIVARFIEDVAEAQDICCIGIASQWEEVLEITNHQTPQIAIVDINIKGGVDGIEVAKRLRQMFDIPMIFLTAYKDVQTVKEAAEASPLAYLIKPVTAEELTANIILAANAVKTQRKNDGKSTYSVCKNGIVYKNDKMLTLTTNERKVLTLLISNANNVVTYDVFFQSIWNDPDKINEGSLRNIVMKLRKNLDDLTIETIKDLGYRLSK